MGILVIFIVIIMSNAGFYHQPYGGLNTLNRVALSFPLKGSFNEVTVMHCKIKAYHTRVLQ